MSSEIWNLFNEINENYECNKEESFKAEGLKDNEYNIESKKNISYEKTTNNIKNATDAKDCCINCNEVDFLIMDGEMIVCTLCGTENSNIIDYHAEWRYYGSDDNKRSSDPNRCGMPTNPHLADTSLSTVILGKGFEVYRKLNSWNGLSYKQRSLIAILNKIATKANIDNVPQSIIDTTMNMYKIISQDYIKRGASRESLIAACFFNALRDQGLIRSTEEVAKLFDIKSKKLSKGCNEFTELMFSKNKDYVKNMKPIESKDLIERFCLLLGIEECYSQVAVRAAIIIDKLGICQENNPKSIAVGCLYLISHNYNLGFTKKEIAEQCKTSEVTVSNTYCQMAKFRKYLLPKE
jgi:transcription initiation factor TFIIIB Brf1 subunit/transcription initiation factor TFIIB